MTTYWNAFLPIGSALKSDEPGLDPAWAAAMGVDPEALSVLRLVRREVLPLMRDLEKPAGTLRSFSFLVHDRASGVPCPPEDSSPYIHLRLEFYDLDVKPSRPWRLADVRRRLPEPWVYVARVKPSKEEIRVQEVLAEQSAWYLRLVERFAAMTDLELLRHVGQTLHYYANMAQMMVR